MASNNPYLVVFCVLLYACGETPVEKDNGKSIEWITGSYQYVNDYGVYRENWKKNNENEYSGRGYFLHNSDTAFFMQMKLYREGKVIKMDYNVRAQNQGKNVAFALTKQDNGLYVFENPFRGFPSIMQYKFLGDTAVNVIERGFENNKDKVKDFTMQRIKED